MHKLTGWMFVFLLGLWMILSSCAPVKIKDYEMYGDMGRFGATKVHTLFTNIPPERIYQPEWDNLRLGMVCTPAANIADIQATVDKLCAKNTTNCDYEKQKAIANFKKNMRLTLIAMRRAGADISNEVMEAFK